jgi:hypothetical protein
MEGLSAKVTELVDSHFGIDLDINLLDKLELTINVFRKGTLSARVDETKRPTMVIALVSVEEH